MRIVDRILATSDPHGENKKLLNLLKTSSYDPEMDLLVICGDMVDRGEENLDCISTCQKLKQNGAVLLKGNHEQFLEASLKEMITSEIWRSRPSENLNNWVKHNGGASMFEEIKNLSNNKLMELLLFTQSLPIYFEIGNYIFTHAGANTRKPIEKNTEDEIVWMEDSFPYCRAYKDKIIFFGHIPTWKLDKYNPKFKNKNAQIWFDKKYKDKVGLDCGVAFGGRLGAIALPSYHEFYE